VSFPKNPFEKGVVTAIYTGPDTFSEILTHIDKSGIKVQEQKLPRNSVFVKRITRGAAISGDSLSLCYPFFSSHLQMPVKPGETVWIIFDRDDGKIGYWISRVHGDATSEDVNYSHFDRAFFDEVEKQTTAMKIGAAESSKQEVDDFPNSSLAPLSGSNPYDLILSGAIQSFPLTQFEPVPRIQKRPGDLIIQGSNNTSISLTVDKGWTKNDEPESAENSASGNEPFEQSGTIDITAGRGRWAQKRTSPPTRINRRGYSEVSKRIDDWENSLISEGDIDFVDDASRVYVSYFTEPDYNFSTAESTPALFDTNAKPEDQIGAAIVQKSDHVRIIARNDDENGIKGTIRIIKEGDPGDNASSICMEPTGNIHISGKEIHIGRTSIDGGEGDGGAVGNMQPYVKGTQLENLLISIISDINTFCDTLITHVTPGFGAPSPQILTAAQTLKASMAIRESEIPTIKSKRIFGE